MVPDGAPRLFAICAAVLPLPYRLETSFLPAFAGLDAVLLLLGVQVALEPCPPPVLQDVLFDVLFVGFVPCWVGEFWLALPFVVDEAIPAGELFAAAKDAGAPELRELRFLSDYRGPPIPAGKKSIAFSVAFQSAERTLTDADAAVLRQRIVDAVERLFGGELRA